MARQNGKRQSGKRQRGKSAKTRGSSSRDLDDSESSRGDQIEEHDDGIFVVRRITGSSSNKPYRCPGCDQLIPTATPHIVAWLEHDVETRRHWHTPCWSARGRRKPKIERTRNAPKY